METFTTIFGIIVSCATLLIMGLGLNELVEKKTHPIVGLVIFTLGTVGFVSSLYIFGPIQ